MEIGQLMKKFESTSPVGKRIHQILVFSEPNQLRLCSSVGESQYMPILLKKTYSSSFFLNIPKNVI